MIERQQAATQKIIIGKDEIEKMGALTIGDVLGKLPGWQQWLACTGSKY
jgi:hypothetical protein